MHSFETLAQLPDLELLTRCQAGEREAFCALVLRHQNAVSARAFAICGDLSRSEDVAQETFVKAWHSIRELRDPARFKAWLCGIARYLALRVVEGRAREAGPLAEDIAATTEEDPHQQLVSREEEARVWHVLERLPEAYRSALILFYREQQSIAAVAETLEISAEAVKQRLTRGRALIREALTAEVETSLARSRPNPALALAVFTAIGGVSAHAGVVGVSVASTLSPGATAGQALGLAGALGGAFGGILFGCLGAWLGAKASEAGAPYEREQQLIRRELRRSVRQVLIFGGSVLLIAIAARLSHQPEIGIAAISFCIAVFLAAIVGSTIKARREVQRIRVEEEAKGTLRRVVPPEWARWVGGNGFVEYLSPIRFLGLPLLHLCFNDAGQARPDRKVARGWIAVGDYQAVGFVAIGLYSCGVFSLGACATGVFTLGGVAVGVFSWAALAAGIWSAGGIAIGHTAFGGLAFAWEIAYGGAAWAAHHAFGGLTYAAHAGDMAAKAAVQDSLWLKAAEWKSLPLIMSFICGSVAPIMLLARGWAARRRAAAWIKSDG